VIEIDGATHETPEELASDIRRTAWLEAQGYRVIPFLQ
jgi:very-short-patch-repair endonuclease